MLDITATVSDEVLSSNSLKSKEEGNATEDKTNNQTFSNSDGVRYEEIPLNTVSRRRRLAGACLGFL